MNRTSHAAFGLARIVCPILLVTFSLSSCKKDEEPEPEPPVNPPASAAYSFPLTDGSYWIYQHEQTDANGTITQIGTTDSMYVEGDTIIGSNTHKKIRTVRAAGNAWLPVEALRIVRDSAGYIVDFSGSFMEHDNFTDTLFYDAYSGMVDAWYFMKHEDSTVTVPVGTFATIDYEGHMYATDPNYQWGAPRYTHQLYADGIGKVREILYYYSSPDYVQRSLLRYHIN